MSHGFFQQKEVSWEPQRSCRSRVNEFENTYKSSVAGIEGPGKIVKRLVREREANEYVTS